MNNIKINNFTEKLERYEDFHLKEIGNWIVVVFILKTSDKILKMITGSLWIHFMIDDYKSALQNQLF